MQHVSTFAMSVDRASDVHLVTETAWQVQEVVLELQEPMVGGDLAHCFQLADDLGNCGRIGCLRGCEA